MPLVAPELAVPNLGYDSPERVLNSLRDSECSLAGSDPETWNGRPHCGNRESGLTGRTPSRGRPGQCSRLATARAIAFSRPGPPSARPLLATEGTAARLPLLWTPNPRVSAHLCSQVHAPLRKLEGTQTSDSLASSGSNSPYPLSLWSRVQLLLTLQKCGGLKCQISYPSLHPLWMVARWPVRKISAASCVESVPPLMED